MKIDKLLSIILILFVFFLILLLNVEPVFASSAKIEFVENPTYYCYKKTKAGYYYNITVTLQNVGDISSPAVDIKLLEDGLTTVWPPDCNRVIFEPQEQKSFYFDWCTTKKSDTFTISYRASDSVNISDDTSGSKIVNVGYEENNMDEGTPGFSFIILLLSIIIFIYVKKTKK